MIAGVNSEHMNKADLSGFMPNMDYFYLDGHDNRVSKLAWHEDNQFLASCGFDGTIRLWLVERSKPPLLDSTLIFHMSTDVFGCELQGRHIGHLMWSPTGEYIAAALDNVINVWPFVRSDQTNLYNDWFIEDQVQFITSMVWPKHKNVISPSNDYLLVGKVDGSVTCITVYKEKKQLVQMLRQFYTIHGNFKNVILARAEKFLE